jgi:hypothetical protein
MLQVGSVQVGELDAAARVHLDDPCTIVVYGLLILTWARCSPALAVSVPLHRIAITSDPSWPSSRACSHFACPYVAPEVPEKVPQIAREPGRGRNRREK